MVVGLVDQESWGRGGKIWQRGGPRGGSGSRGGVGCGGGGGGVDGGDGRPGSASYGLTCGVG